MNRQDRFRLVGDFFFNQRWIDIVIGTNINKNWLRTGCNNGTNGCVKGERRGDDLVAFINTQRLQTQKQGIRSTANANSMSRAAKLRIFILKQINFGAEGKVAANYYFTNLCPDRIMVGKLLL